jgi:hypothetical protein
MRAEICAVVACAVIGAGIGLVLVGAVMLALATR